MTGLRAVEGECGLDVTELPVYGEIGRGDARTCALLAVQEDELRVKDTGSQPRADEVVATPGCAESVVIERSSQLRLVAEDHDVADARRVQARQHPLLEEAEIERVGQ